MRGGGLDTTPCGRDEPFDGGCVQTACKFLLFRFDTRDDGDSEEFFVDTTIEVEDLTDFCVGLFLGEVCGVAFLPKELAGTEEWFWSEKMVDYEK